MALDGNDDMPSLYDQAEEAAAGKRAEEFYAQWLAATELDQPGRRSWNQEERTAFLSRYDSPPQAGLNRSLALDLGDAEALRDQAQHDLDEATEEFRAAERIINSEHLAERALTGEGRAEYEMLLATRGRLEAARRVLALAQERYEDLRGLTDDDVSVSDLEGAPRDLYRDTGLYQ